MSSLREFLAENHYPLAINRNELTGPGADFLSDRAEESSFFLLGEEHGVGSNLDFACALFHLIRPLGFDTYLTEVGPFSARHLNRLARDPDGLAAFQEFYTQYPFSIPFAWLKEEVRLLQAVAAAAPGRENAIIGIDQEFLFSPQLHLETLQQNCSQPQFHANLADWLQAERQANADMQNGKPPDQLASFMNAALPVEWQTLRRHFVSQGNGDAIALMDAVQASHEIYMHYAHEEYYENNHVRGLLMRKYFYTAYKQRMADDPAAKFLIKLGANHVERGHSAMGIQDIGNSISEFAMLNGAQSFHLFVLPLDGAQNAWLPFLPETFKEHPIEENTNPAIQPLLEAFPGRDGWHLYDLRPLRQRQTYWSNGNLEFKQFFRGYDALLTMSPVRAAELVI